MIVIQLFILFKPSTMQSMSRDYGRSKIRRGNSIPSIQTDCYEINYLEYSQTRKAWAPQRVVLQMRYLREAVSTEGPPQEPPQDSQEQRPSTARVLRSHPILMRTTSFEDYTHTYPWLYMYITDNNVKLRNQLLGSYCRGCSSSSRFGCCLHRLIFESGKDGNDGIVVHAGVRDPPDIRDAWTRGIDERFVLSSNIRSLNRHSKP